MNEPRPGPTASPRKEKSILVNPALIDCQMIAGGICKDCGSTDLQLFMVYDGTTLPWTKCRSCGVTYEFGVPMPTVNLHGQLVKAALNNVDDNGGKS